ncbi:hypothetical protein B5V01_00265 [Mesorhizobium erdmanii]|uniref:Uncharacterized protein n=2 Tax=Mesorhizobium TaxID=68287 RepID=A0A3M9X1T5_9HYPH|nr:hypothetical protein DNR46_33825 [Mesorhizobium japonicum]RXT53352.1 hypothetical protein B5V01_00265 [Mesorhizobium erdmanii]
MIKALDTNRERNDNNQASRAPAPEGDIMSESGGAVISESRGGFVGIGTPDREKKRVTYGTVQKKCLNDPNQKGL